MLTFGPGKAGDIATGFARAVRQQFTTTAKNGQTFGGVPADGALFSTSGGQLKQHFCTASVINSPNGDLLITAAHCVTGTSGTIVFVPGYDGGARRTAKWTVTRVYLDQAWKSSANPDDDVAILQASQPITCQNWLTEPMTDQLEFDCGAYTDGTSGGPFLTDIGATTGQGTVVGIIGGYEQGGDTPRVSYSAVLGANVAALFKTTVAGG